LHGDLIGLGTAYERAEARHAAIHQLDAPGPELNVIDGSVAIAFSTSGDKLGIALESLRLLPERVLDAHEGLLGKEGGDATIQGLTQVWSPQLAPGHRVKQLSGVVDNRWRGRSPSLETSMAVKP
jgi:hypothetical protein